MLRTISRPALINQDVRGMCTALEQTNKEQKFNYMKNLVSHNDTESKPPDWDTAKPYSEIPGPKSVPIFGNLWRFLPLIGPLYGVDQITQHRLFNREYGDIMKLSGLKIRKDLVILFNPDDIEKAYRNEGAWPLRESLESFVYYKMNVRPDVFKGQGGVLTGQGEEWYKTRSVVNPPMMQPRSAQLYVESMDGVAQDFIQRMKQLAKNSPNAEMPEDFSNELNKWALESICLVGLNKRLGLLDPNKHSPEGQQFITDVLTLFDLLNELDVKPSLWKWVSTPLYRKYVKTLDRITAFELKHMHEAVENLKNKKSDTPENELSILEKLLKKDEKIAFAMSFDMLIAGIDTTSRISSAALYYLASNLDAQEKLRVETKKFLPNPDSQLTTEILNKMPYLKAVIKETTRLAPIAIGNLRQSNKDLVLSGYQIPKGSDLIMAHMMLCRREEHFRDAEKFIPDRWLRTSDNEHANKDLNPWVFMPFGFGPRSCVGKRLANLEIEILLSKIVRNYRLEWPHEEMKWTMSMLYGVGSPLKFHVTPVKT